MTHRLAWIGSVLLALGSPLIGSAVAAGDEASPFAELGAEYERDVRPLIASYCLDCHSTAESQGDLDLERFRTLKEVRGGTKTWLKVAEQLDAGEMPPQDARQPAADEQKRLRAWVDRYLRAEAEANAGDPGPVVLRRLNNAEYNYTVRDLTGVDLQPAREFPTDSAAGEGFTNVGNALSMSPALFSKYLDASKQIAQHAVLLPDGFRFSSSSTPRDWTNATVGRIREFYQRHVETVDLGKGESVGVFNLHGDCRLGQLGKLPLEKYFLATLEERAALSSGARSVAEVAVQRGLNARYLGLLWEQLNSSDPSSTLCKKKYWPHNGLRRRSGGVAPCAAT